MSEPLRAHEPDGPEVTGGAGAGRSPLAAVPPAGAGAETDAVLRELMDDVRRKADTSRAAKPKRSPLKPLLLLVLLASNVYLWTAHPQWLIRQPSSDSFEDAYAARWRLAVTMHRREIESWRRTHGTMPLRTRWSLGSGFRGFDQMLAHATAPAHKHVWGYTLVWLPREQRPGFARALLRADLAFLLPR